MTLATQSATSNGTMTVLNISIDYFDRADISVSFDGVVNARQWAWVGTTTKQISFSPAVANGVVVFVQRLTLATQIRNIYALGAAFNASSMDDNFKQLLFLSQEARENSTAYGIAVANGFVGTQTQWLATLVGATGPTGATGPAGPANTLSIGTVTQGATAASITGTAPNQVLNLVLAQGAQGTQGVQGTTGAAGPANSLAIGTVTVGTAAASITGVAPTQTLNLVLEQGPQGIQGVQGLPGSGTNVIVKDEGTTLTAACTEMNFVGAGIQATNTGTVVTITVNAVPFDITTEQMFWIGQ